MNGNIKFMLYDDDLRSYFLKKLDRFIDHDLSKWSLLPLREIYFISLIFCKHFAPPPSLSKVDAVHWLAHLTSQYCKDQGSIPELKGKKWLALKPLIVQ